MELKKIAFCGMCIHWRGFRGGEEGERWFIGEAKYKLTV